MDRLNNTYFDQFKYEFDYCPDFLSTVLGFLKENGSGTVESYLRFLKQQYGYLLIVDPVSLLSSCQKGGLIQLINMTPGQKVLYTNLFIKPTFKELWRVWLHEPVKWLNNDY